MIEGVRIDVYSPLKKEMNARTLGETWITAKVKYERLGTFYFLCGVLGHRDKTCAKLFEVEEDDDFREWSNDLKPESRKRGVNTVNRCLRDPGEVGQPVTNTEGGNRWESRW